METETQATLAAALAAGYVLGRTKKGKLAIGVASVVAGQGLLSPKELINRALRKAAESPQAEQLLGQLRGELMDSARTALSATADRRLKSLADSLQQRTTSLVGKPDAEEEEPPEDEETPEGEESDAEDESDDQEPADQEPAGEDEDDEEGEEAGEEEPEEEEPEEEEPEEEEPEEEEPEEEEPQEEEPQEEAEAPPPRKSRAKKAPAKKKAAAGETPSRGSRRR